MKIMFICTGNICRSAMAHKLLEKKLEEKQINDIQVYSSGIYAENGDTSTYNAIETMKEYGVDLKSHIATNIRNSEIDKMDLILCATLSHKREVLYLYPELQGKVYTMKEYVGDDKETKDISDPWGYDLTTYQRCALEINEILDKLMEKILNQKEN
ncbi:MAG: low molecular weight protein arginine phosphatase [Clostridia bacterium]